MWRKHPQFTETGITLISSLWPDSVPSYLDAVYQNVEKNVLLFFKGKVNTIKEMNGENAAITEWAVDVKYMCNFGFR